MTAFDRHSLPTSRVGASASIALRHLVEPRLLFPDLETVYQWVSILHYSMPLTVKNEFLL